MPIQEEKKHKTPNGGDRSVIYYQDDKGTPVDKSEAKAFEIVEFKGKKEIQRTYGTIGK